VYRLRLIIWGKKLLPEEISVQERHPGGSAADEKKLTGETMLNMADELGVKRRPLLGLAALAGMAPLGVVIAAPLVGGLIKDPHKPNIFMFTAWDPTKNTDLRGGYPNAPTNAAGLPSRSPATRHYRPGTTERGGQLTALGLPIRQGSVVRRS
jgi:ubiquinol-cytochrome c reductase iron-sulfur subunit